MQGKNVKHILIVDDEEAIVFSYQKLFTGAQLEVDVCTDIETAYKMLSDKDYCAVITDLRLSDSEGTEGLDLLRHIRSTSPDTLVMIMTGYGSDEIKEHVRSADNVLYFDKPIAVSELKAALIDLGIIDRE